MRFKMFEKKKVVPSFDIRDLKLSDLYKISKDSVEIRIGGFHYVYIYDEEMIKAIREVLLTKKETTNGQRKD